MKTTTNSRVITLLKTLNLDESELAKRIQKHPSTIYRIVANETEPSKTTLRLIADELNVDYNWLVTGQGEMQMQSKAKKSEDKNPWKDEAYSTLKEAYASTLEQMKFLQDQLAMAMMMLKSGKSNPLNFTAGSNNMKPVFKGN